MFAAGGRIEEGDSVFVDSEDVGEVLKKGKREDGRLVVVDERCA